MRDAYLLRVDDYIYFFFDKIRTGDGRTLKMGNIFTNKYYIDFEEAFDVLSEKFHVGATVI